MTNTRERSTMRTDKCRSGDEATQTSRPVHAPSRCDPQILVRQRGLGLERRVGRLPRVRSLQRLNRDGRVRKTNLVALRSCRGSFPARPRSTGPSSRHRAPGPLTQCFTTKRKLSQLFPTRSSSEAVITNGPGSLPVSWGRKIIFFR